MPPAPIPLNEAARLTTLRSYTILDTPPEKIYDDMTQLASVMCETPISTITFIDRDRQWLKSAVGVPDRETSRDESFCAHTVVAGGHPVVVEDTRTDPRFADNPSVTGPAGIRFYAGVPLVAPNGHVLGSICVVDTKPRTLAPAKLRALELLSTQIIAQLQARAALMESRRAAAALMHTDKLAAVGKLTASMSQEIKNPLETISNLVYLARQHVQDPEVQGWLDQADKEMHRITAATNHALLFGQQPPAARQVTCLDLISTALGIFAGRLKHTGIVVERRDRATEPVLCFDADIRQVLGHLFSNAIDAMPHGGRLLLRSRLATRNQEQGLVLTIADTGTGIPPSLRDRLFQPFFTTKGKEGSGLGLWISNDIIRRHHGAIAIRGSQRPGRSGTVVTIFLPLRGTPVPVTIPVEDAIPPSALYGTN